MNAASLEALAAWACGRYVHDRERRSVGPIVATSHDGRRALAEVEWEDGERATLELVRDQRRRARPHYVRVTEHIAGDRYQLRGRPARPQTSHTQTAPVGAAVFRARVQLSLPRASAETRSQAFGALASVAETLLDDVFTDEDAEIAVVVEPSGRQRALLTVTLTLDGWDEREAERQYERFGEVFDDRRTDSSFWSMPLRRQGVVGVVPSGVAISGEVDGRRLPERRGRLRFV